MLGLYVFALNDLLIHQTNQLDYDLGVFIGLNVLGLISGMIGAALDYCWSTQFR